MSKSTNKGFSIVMADPNIDDHTLVKKATRECRVNHVFTSVYNGIQLMNLLEKKDVYYSTRTDHPDLVIMDIDLPLLSGTEALQKIRQIEALLHIPVYFLTNNNSPEEKEKLLTLGATGFYTKPLQFNELLTIITGICELHFDLKA